MGGRESDGEPVGITTLPPRPGIVPLPAPALVDITAPLAPTGPSSGLAGPSAGAGAPETSAGERPAPTPPSTAATGAAVTIAPTAVPGTGAAANPAPRAARSRRQRTRRRLTWALVVVLALVVAGAGWVGGQRINRPLPVPTQRSSLPAALTVSGSSPTLPWPTTGQGAVSIPALDYAEQSGPESSVPIASLTKMTNALVVLRDHPLPAGADGPAIAITADDVAEYDLELHEDQSTVAIRTGEVLTERQMLEALLTQSANDIAYSLAVWDSGSIPAFVAKMNALAASLGAGSTHYVDASGYDPQSVSTAADCLRIAAAAMQVPTFAEVVGMSQVTLPLIGTVPNIVTEIGSNGVVGIKSGYTSEARGCMVLAADRVVQGRSVLVLVAVLGQPTPPPSAPKATTTEAPPASTTPTTAAPVGGAVPATTAPPQPTEPTTTTTVPLNDLNVPDPFRYTRPVVEGLLTATEAAVIPVAVTTRGQVVGTVTAHWGSTDHQVDVVASKAAWFLGWPGQQVAVAIDLAPVRPGGSPGSRTGTARYTLGSQLDVVPLQLAATVPEPSWWWRLVHN